MSWVNGLRRYVRLPRRAPQIAREIDEELRFHVDMRAEALRRDGLSADAARREALRRFGDLDGAARYCREMDGAGERTRRRAAIFDELRQDATLAVRQLARSPGFAAPALLTLAFGVAITTTVAAVVDAYLLRGLPFPNAERIAWVIAGPSRDPFPNAPRLDPVDWRTVEPLFERTVAWDLDGFTVVGDGRSEYVDGAWVSPGYFEVLGVRTSAGRTFAADDYRPDARVAVISHALWMRRFAGDPRVVGTTLRLFSTDRPREEHLVTIVGVMTAEAWHVNRFTDILRPLTTPRMPSLALLRSGAGMAEAERRLNAVVVPQLSAPDPAWRMSLRSVHDEHVYRARPMLLTLAAAAALVFALACANVAGLLTTRNAARRREMSIRSALGAGRGRLVRQLLVETGMLVGLAGAAGVTLAHLTIGMLRGAIETQLGVTVPGGEAALRLDGRVLSICITLCALIATLVGLRLATVGSRAALSGTLRLTGGVGAGRAERRERNRLLVVQLALAFALLSGAGLMLRSASAMADVTLGFEPAGVLKAHLLFPLARYATPGERRLGMQRVLERLRAEPEVVAAAAVFPHPFRGGPSAPVTAEGRGAAGDADRPHATPHTISTDYFAVLRVPLLAGRAFAASDADAAPVAIVSDDLARRLWPGESPVGRRLRVGEAEEWRTVVGVVAGVRKTITGELLPDVYIPFDQAARAYTALVVRGRGDAPELATPLHQALASVDEVLAPSDVAPLSTAVESDRARPRMLAALLSGFSAFALGLAALGLGAAVAAAVVQRRRELAVRMAVGATGRDVLGMLLREGVRLMALGIAIGGCLAGALGAVLSSQLFGVRRSDPAVYAAAAAVLGAAALIAILVPARGATRLDPAEVLRES